METDGTSQVYIGAKCINVSVFVIRISPLSFVKPLLLPTPRYTYIIYRLLFVIKDGWKITGASNMENIPDVAVRVEVLVLSFNLLISVVL